MLSEFFRYFAGKEQKLSAKDSTSTTFPTTGHHSSLLLDLLTLLFLRMGFIFFYSESVRQTVLIEHFHYYKAHFVWLLCVFHLAKTQMPGRWLLLMNAIYSSLCMWLSELLYVDATCRYTCTHGLIHTYKWPTCN